MNIDENLARVVRRYEELESLLADPGAIAQEAFANMSREYASLTPVVEAIKELGKARDELGDLAELMTSADSDADMRTMAEDEFQNLKTRVPELEHGVRILLLPKDEADEKNAILEVRAGTGGEEASGVRELIRTAV